MSKIPDQLLSRKLWLTVSTAIVLIVNQQWNELVLLVMAYIGVEGTADVVGRYKESKATTTELSIEDDIETGAIIPGSQYDKKLEDSIDPDDEDWKEEKPL